MCRAVLRQLRPADSGLLRRVVVMAGVGVLSFALAGCGLGEEGDETQASSDRRSILVLAEGEQVEGADTETEPETEPEPESDDTAPEPETEPDPETDTEPESAGGLPPVGLPTRVCITNNSSLAATLNFTIFKKSDGDKTLARGESGCGQGQQLPGNDIEVQVRLPIRHSYRVDGNKPLAGPPVGRLSQLYNYYCTPDQGIEKNTTRVWDDGVVKFTLKRGPDSNDVWNIDAVLEDSTNPSADGKQTRC